MIAVIIMIACIEKIKLGLDKKSGQVNTSSNKQYHQYRYGYSDHQGYVFLDKLHILILPFL